MALSIKIQSRWMIQNMRFSKHLKGQNDLHKSEKDFEIKTLKWNKDKANSFALLANTTHTNIK